MAQNRKRKFYRAVHAKPGKLIAQWGRMWYDMEAAPELVTAGRNEDVCYMLTHVFTREFEKELKARGYDLSTLKFSVEKAS